MDALTFFFSNLTLWSSAGINSWSNFLDIFVNDMFLWIGKSNMHNFIDFFSLEQESEAVYACNENLMNAEIFHDVRTNLQIPIPCLLMEN